MRVLISPILHCYSRWTVCAYLDCFIRISNECNEETQHHIDEQTDEGVEVDPTEQPNQVTFLLHLCKGGKHVISIDQWKKAFRNHVESAKLERREEDKDVSLLYLDTKTVPNMKNIHSSWLAASDLFLHPGDDKVHTVKHLRNKQSLSPPKHMCIQFR